MVIRCCDCGQAFLTVGGFKIHAENHIKGYTNENRRHWGLRELSPRDVQIYTRALQAQLYNLDLAGVEDAT